VPYLITYVLIYFGIFLHWDLFYSGLGAFVPGFLLECMGLVQLGRFIYYPGMVAIGLSIFVGMGFPLYLPLVIVIGVLIVYACRR